MSNDRNEISRTGLRVVTRIGVHNDVRRAVLKFASWIRLRYEFPIRLTIYLSGKEHICLSSGECGSSLFLEPFNKTDEPHITIAAGDYASLLKECGNRDDALCATVNSAVLHILNYQNWWFDHTWSKATIGRNRKKLLRAYATDVKFII